MKQMLQRTLIGLGAVWGVCLLMLSLWSWRNNENAALYMHAHNRVVFGSAVRCASVALAAAGEAVLLIFVIGNLWRRDLFTNWLVLSAVTTLMLSVASAVALGLAGR